MEKISEWYGLQTEKIARKMVSHNIIEKENLVIYQYGIAQIGYMLLYVFTYAVIAAVTRNVKLLVWYLVCFTALRVSAGGFHLKRRITCYFMTTGCVLGISWILKQDGIVLHELYQTLFFAAGCLGIWILAPIDTPNRRVDETEYKVYRRRTIAILALEVTAYLWLMSQGEQRMAFATFVAVFQEMIFLCLGKKEAAIDK